MAGFWEVGGYNSCLPSESPATLCTRGCLQQTLHWTCALRCFLPGTGWATLRQFNPAFIHSALALWRRMELAARWKPSVVFASQAAISSLVSAPIVSLEIHASPTLSPWDLVRSSGADPAPGSRANDPAIGNQPDPAGWFRDKHSKPMKPSCGAFIRTVGG